MSCQILVIDSKAERSDTVRDLVAQRGLCARRIENLREAVGAVESDSQQYVVLAHCDFLNDSFTSLARLRMNPRVKILFYSTDAREKLRSAPLIPDEAEQLIERIQVSCASVPAENQAAL